MDKVAMALFEDQAAANVAVEELAKCGFARNNIHMLHPAAGVAGKAEEKQGSAFHRFLATVGLAGNSEPAAGQGLSATDSRLFEEAVNRGGTIVAVEVPSDAMLAQAGDIFEHEGAVDIDERAKDWRASGWVESSAEAAAPTVAETSAPAAGETVTVPVVEEALQVGKREIHKPGVRVFKRVTTRPVEQTVKLREEELKVERRPASRPATEADLKKAAEGVVIPVVAEEAVVAKQPRVVEEVVIAKEMKERVEPVQAEIRREEVAVEPSAPASEHTQDQPAEMKVESGRNETLEAAWREHFQRVYGSSGNNFDVYLPAYRFGADLSRRTGGSDLKAAEQEGRREWERQQPGSWDNFRAAIQYGFERARKGVASVTRPATVSGEPAGAAGEREPVKPPQS